MNDAFNKLCLGVVLITFALLVPSKTTAETIVLSSFTNLVTQHAQDYPEFGGTSVNYSASNICFTNYNGGYGQVITSNPKFSLVLSLLTGIEGQHLTYADIGGLDGVGTTATGWINASNAFFSGLGIGQAANTTENGGVWDGLSWTGFVDLNGNGTYGTLGEFGDGYFVYNLDPGEMIMDVTVSNFQPFQIGAGALSAGNISGVYAMPDLSSASIRFGTTAASIGQSNTFTVAVCTTNLSFFRIEHKDGLTNAAWTSMAQYSVTGAVTFVTDTNAAPNRYYRAIAP